MAACDDQEIANCASNRVELRVQNLPTGLYGVYQSGHLTQCQHVQKGEVVEVSVEVGGDEVDVVLVQQQK